MKEIKDFGHQGDLNFRPAKEVPKGAKDITSALIDQERGGYLLALGEVTGHAHVLVKEKKTDVKIMEQNGRRYIVVNGAPVKLLHGTFTAPGKVRENETDKHQVVILPPGIYEQGFEVGYNPWLKTFKQVID
jgi:hypothetical protein